MPSSRILPRTTRTFWLTAALSVALPLIVIASVLATRDEASAASNYHASPTQTAFGYYYNYTPLGPVPVPVLAHWYAEWGGVWTDYGGYYHLDSWAHGTLTTTDYVAYSGHMVSNTESWIHNASGQLRYAFGAWFGTPCYMPYGYTQYNCGYQATSIWIKS